MTSMPALLVPLAFDLSDLVGVVVFLVFLLVGGARSAGRKAAQRAREEDDGDDEAGPDEAATSSARAEELRAEIAEAVRRLTGAGPDTPAARPPVRPAAPRPAPAASRTPARGRAPTPRRKGLVDDAHVELSSRLPTSDDMPGARAAHEPGHGHLAEIGRDRGTAPAHLGAKPSPAAKAPHERSRLSPKQLLSASRLEGRDRLRAGLLWLEVLGPPRSRRSPRR